VLVVDDDADIREIVRMLLEAGGYRVLTACDGLDAWEQLERSEAPALILLDLMMPRMDGEQFLQQLRSTRDAGIPVVIMSGHGVSEEKAARYAASGCLAKPIDLDDLLDVVQRIVPAPRSAASD
jgi:CheY-like chemotaxis protein